MIKVLHVANSDLRGGACRSAYRIHRGLADHAAALGVFSEMRVLDKISNDETVFGKRPYEEPFYWQGLQLRLNRRRYKGFTLGKPASYSIAWPKTYLEAELNNSKADIINLHWLGNHTISIEEIGRLKKPLVWCLPDMWSFCGAEHYVNEYPEIDKRFIDGYWPTNRNAAEKGIDLNRITWERKLKNWRTPIHIVCPTNWLANHVRNSYLMKDWPVSVIPTPVDLNIWKPVNKASARDVLGLPKDDTIVLFGAIHGTADKRKGADLLFEALQFLAENENAVASNKGKISLAIFGSNKPNAGDAIEIPSFYFGHLNDDISLRLLYSAADVMVVPSRQDNLPNTVMEALACGTPVVAFDIGGLPEMLTHQQSGWLAKAFKVDDLAKGIFWVTEDKERLATLSINARREAESKFDPCKMAQQYEKLYSGILNELHHR